MKTFSAVLLTIERAGGTVAVSANVERDLPSTQAWAARARARPRLPSRDRRPQSARDPQLFISLTEHVFEHLGHAVVAGCGCEVVGSGNRVWMTA